MKYTENERKCLIDFSAIIPCEEQLRRHMEYLNSGKKLFRKIIDKTDIPPDGLSIIEQFESETINLISHKTPMSLERQIEQLEEMYSLLDNLYDIRKKTEKSIEDSILYRSQAWEPVYAANAYLEEYKDNNAIGYTGFLSVKPLRYTEEERETIARFNDTISMSDQVSRLYENLTGSRSIIEDSFLSPVQKEMFLLKTDSMIAELQEYINENKPMTTSEQIDYLEKFYSMVDIAENTTGYMVRCHEAPVLVAKLCLLLEEKTKTMEDDTSFTYEGKECTKVSTVEIIKKIGFRQEVGGLPDTFKYKSSNLQLSACAGLSLKSFEYTVSFSGFVHTERTMEYIEFEMPLEVDSFEQGMAWLAWHIDQQKNDRSCYNSDFLYNWLEIGYANYHLLPWEKERIERKREEEAYQAEYMLSPHCTVEREWARILRGKINAIMEDAEEPVQVVLSFNGEMLIVRCTGMLMPMPANGKAWENSFLLDLEPTWKLPKRFINEQIEFAIFREKLMVDHCSSLDTKVIKVI